MWAYKYYKLMGGGGGGVWCQEKMIQIRIFDTTSIIGYYRGTNLSYDMLCETII